MGGGKDKHTKDHGGEMPQGFGRPYGYPPQGNSTPYVQPPAPVPSAYPSGVYPPPMPGVHLPAQGGHAQSKHKYLETLGSIYSQVHEFLPHHHNGHSHGGHLKSDAAVMANAAIRLAKESIDCLGVVGCTTYEHEVSDNIGSSTILDAKMLADQSIIHASESIDHLGVVGSTASDHRVPNNIMFMDYQNSMDTLGSIG